VIPGDEEQGLQSAARDGFGPAIRSLLAASDGASISGVPPIRPCGVHRLTCRTRAAHVPHTCRKRNSTDRYGLIPMCPLSRAFPSDGRIPCVPEPPCQGGGRGFESRRPLQRNRRSRCVRAGGSSSWEPTKVPGGPSGSRRVHDFVTHPGASGPSTAPPLGSDRGRCILVQPAHDSYRSTPHELLGGRPATPPLMDVERCRRIVCRMGSVCPGGGSSPSSKAGAGRRAAHCRNTKCSSDYRDCVLVGSPRVRTPDADRRRSGWRDGRRNRLAS
jgi:hypothetical protein